MTTIEQVRRAIEYVRDHPELRYLEALELGIREAGIETVGTLPVRPISRIRLLAFLKYDRLEHAWDRIREYEGKTRPKLAGEIWEHYKPLRELESRRDAEALLDLFAYMGLMWYDKAKIPFRVYLTPAEYIGVGTAKGHEVYYNRRDDEYFTLLRGKRIRTAKTVEIDYTASIDTAGGHEPFYAEITATFVVTGQDRKAIKGSELIIQRKISDYIKEKFDKEKKPESMKLSDKIIKTGVEYDVKRARVTDYAHVLAEKKEYTKRIKVLWKDEEDV